GRSLPREAGDARRLSRREPPGAQVYLVEGGAGQPLEHVLVASRHPFDHLAGKVGCGRLLVPLAVSDQLLQVVAERLFVERRLPAAGRVEVGWPEPGRIGGEDLVDQDDRPVFAATELEL